jgi:cell division protein ZapE
MTPQEYYQQDLQKEGFVHDPQQELAVDYTQALYDNFFSNPAPKTSWLEKLIAPAPPSIKGLYFSGGTGRGKTYLVDCFYKCIPIKEKHRVHFHRFMLEIHEQLKQLPQSPNPLAIIGRSLAKQYRFLCLDEFHVHDIADAMIMAGLLDAMFKSGLILVTTSNIAIADLYKNGLQRDRFLPAIQLLHENLDEFDLLEGTDFRFKHLTSANTYQVCSSESGKQYLETRMEKMAHVPLKHQRSIMINHRPINYLGLADDLIWFDFEVICNTPRAASDYIELACQFHTMLIGHVTPMNEEQDDVAKRFIHLIDALYDHNVKLIISSDNLPADLYRGRRLTFAFHRTVSRLSEMSSREYMSKKHLCYSETMS